MSTRHQVMAGESAGGVAEVGATRMVNDEMRSRMSRLVEALPDAQREVLRLRYVEALSRAEIAEVVDAPESVVKSRLFEGLRRLRGLVRSSEES